MGPKQRLFIADSMCTVRVENNVYKSARYKWEISMVQVAKKIFNESARWKWEITLVRVQCASDK